MEQRGYKLKKNEALYLQIHAQLLAEIREGKYETSRLPTEKELTEQYYVSRITARKALEKLASDGVVVRISGKGTFVRKSSHILSGPVQAPRSGKPLIALVMGGYSASFGLDIMNAAIEASEEEGAHIIVKNAGNDQAREFQILSSLKDSGVDGIIVQPAHGEIYSQWLINAVFEHYPIVMIDRTLPGIDVPFVGVDNERLSEKAAGKLIEAGHRNIALITLENGNTSTLKARMEGFKLAMNRHQMPVNTDLWLTGLATRLKGTDKNSREAYDFYIQQIGKHLRQHPEITGFFCTEYLVSKLVYTALAKLGMAVPGDYSIAGFDGGGEDSRLFAHVLQPQDQMGRVAVQMVSALIWGEKRDQPRRLLEGTWVPGHSIAAPASR